MWGANHPNLSDRGTQLSRADRALEDLDVGSDVRHGRVPESRVERNGIGRPSRGVHRGQPDPGDVEPRVPGDRVFPVNPEASALDEEALEKINRNVLARVFWEDPAFMSSTRLRKTFSLRLCIINHTTTWDDVRETLEAIERFGREALSKGKHDGT